MEQALSTILANQNLGLQMHEQKPLVSGDADTNALSKAFSSPLIKNCSLEDITGALRLSFVKVGLRAANLPSDLERQVLIDFIIRNYSGHTIQEINLAFDLAIMEKLDVETNHYENFTCKYFASIMKAYRRWAANRHDEATKKPVLMLEDKQEMTDEEWEEWIEAIKDYKFEAIPVVLYDYYKRTGKIILTDEEKHLLMERSISYHLSTLELLTPERSHFEKMKNEGVFDKQATSRLKNLSKKFAIQDYLKSKTTPDELNT